MFQISCFFNELMGSLVLAPMYTTLPVKSVDTEEKVLFFVGWLVGFSYFSIIMKTMILIIPQRD